eukprot:scaffold102977_cov16-Tisochrysis_lutea.AAC.2
MRVYHKYFVQGGDGKWHFGDKAMPEKHFPVVDALTRGFTIEIRFLLYDEPCDVEDCLCKVFDFALNDRKSGPVKIEAFMVLQMLDTEGKAEN